MLGASPGVATDAARDRGLRARRDAVTPTAAAHAVLGGGRARRKHGAEPVRRC